MNKFSHEIMESIKDLKESLLCKNIFSIDGKVNIADNLIIRTTDYVNSPYLHLYHMIDGIEVNDKVS